MEQYSHDITGLFLFRVVDAIKKLGEKEIEKKKKKKKHQ